jgi:RNA polymerase sigma factor for flagellar operon FliA
MAVVAERNRLLLEQLPQVRSIARRIHGNLPKSVALEDLVQSGVLGLIDALEKYDPAKNVHLHSYAKFRIRGAILDSLRDLDWGPRDLRNKARRMEQAHQKLEAGRGCAATEPELAAEMGMDLEEFYRFLGDLNAVDLESLDADGLRAGEEKEDPFHICLFIEMKSLLSRAMGALPAKERRVLALYYFEDKTMKEIGATLGVGESRVSQIHSSTVARVRARIRELMTRGKRPRSHDSSASLRFIPILLR